MLYPTELRARLRVQCVVATVPATSDCVLGRISLRNKLRGDTPPTRPSSYTGKRDAWRDRKRPQDLLRQEPAPTIR
jgi:hypothetical protein